MMISSSPSSSSDDGKDATFQIAAVEQEDDDEEEDEEDESSRKYIRMDARSLRSYLTPGKKERQADERLKAGQVNRALMLRILPLRF